MDRQAATNALLPGTLDMLVLKTLTRGPLHGYGIAQYLLQRSDNVLSVGEGSLSPALQRLLANGWVSAEWKQSETGRRARFYSLSSAGHKRLADEEREFDRMIDAIRIVLRET